jgi:hypothetical protein
MVRGQTGNKTTHRLLNRLWTLAYSGSNAVSAAYRLRAFPHPMEHGVTLITSRTTPRSAVWLYYKHKAAVQSQQLSIVVLNEQCAPSPAVAPPSPPPIAVSTRSAPPLCISMGGAGHALRHERRIGSGLICCGWAASCRSPQRLG